MNKLKYFRQGQEISIEELNKIVDNVNDFILLYTQLINYKADIETAQITHNALINNFITSYYSILQETPNILEILNAYTNTQQPTEVNVAFPSLSIIDNKWHINGVDTSVFATGNPGTQGAEGPQGQQGDRGYTVFPSINNGILSWVVYDADNIIVTNHGLTLPSPVSLKGPQGEAGNDGLTTTIKWYFAPNNIPVASEIFEYSEGQTIPSSANFFKVETTLEGQVPVSTGWVRYRQPIYVPSVSSQGVLSWTLSGNNNLENIVISPVNLRGEDGTSVAVKGNLANQFDLPQSGAVLGDGYLIDGFLFVYTGKTDTSGISYDVVGFASRGFENVGEIKGPQGDTGPFFELQTTESHIQKKRSDLSVWEDFISLLDITGPQGLRGYPIRLRISGENDDQYIEWAVNDPDIDDANKVWTQLFTKNNLRGYALQIRFNANNANLLETKYSNETEWTEILDLFQLIYELVLFDGTDSLIVEQLVDAEGERTGQIAFKLADAYGDIKNPYGEKTANQVLVAPLNESGAAIDGAPVFRVLIPSDIPALDAGKITTGTLSTLRIPDLGAGKITTGTLDTARIPNLSADKITSDTINSARLPVNAINQAGIVPAPLLVNANKVYSTDSEGNPGWQNNVIDTDTWQANTNAQEGYVASGSGQDEKVWKTDDEGNPAWRTDGEHAHGYIREDGSIAQLFTGPNGTGADKILISDFSDDRKIKAGPGLKENNTTEYLRADGTFAVPPDTWQPNLEGQAGYVAGTNTPNVVWKTNSLGQPGWRDEKDTWVSNTRDRNGYVTSPGFNDGSTDPGDRRVWATNLGDSETAWAKVSSLIITESQISDLGSYITDYTVTQADVTAHQAALSITKSQVSDFGSYEPANANIQTHIGTTTGNPHSVTASDLGLGNVDNTSDASKPVSTATQTALNLKANLASPILSGTPTAPTPTTTLGIANKGYVDTAINNAIIGDVPIEWVLEASYYTNTPNQNNLSTDITFNWDLFDYKIVFDFATNLEDNNFPHMYINNEISSSGTRFNFMYRATNGQTNTQSITSQSKTYRLELGGGLPTGNVNPSATTLQGEVIISKGLYSFDFLGTDFNNFSIEGYTVATPMAAPTNTTFYVQESRFIGNYSGQATINQLNFYSNLLAGSSDFSKLRVYKRAK